jgi:hypothetical protein
MTKAFQKPSEAIEWTKRSMLDFGFEVHTEKWQSIDAPDAMWEKFNHSFSFMIPERVGDLVREVKPNLPWADDHFDERVSGIPLNPPPSNEWWPFNQRKNEEFKKEEQFSHTYPERMWPKFGGEKFGKSLMSDHIEEPQRGLRYDYGDFDDVVNLLKNEPFTRQAFLPIWFPEDTGSVHGERVPCTIGYHFIRRGDHLHVIYYIRSCDFIRHFRDDVYLACRKVLWVLDKLKQMDHERWKDVKPGWYTMHITSLHCFNKEKGLLKLKKT